MIQKKSLSRNPQCRLIGNTTSHEMACNELICENHARLAKSVKRVEDDSCALFRMLRLEIAQYHGIAERESDYCAAFNMY